MPASDDEPRDQETTSTSQEMKSGGSSVGGEVSLEGPARFTGRDYTEGLKGTEVTALLDVVLKYFRETSLQSPQQLDNLLKQFQQHQEELREWKELHNFLDTTIQKYDQFLKAVHSAEKMPPDIDDLRNSWFSIGLTLDSLLAWASKITRIGEPYSDQGGSLRGEAWAIRLESTRREIEKHLNAQLDLGGKPTLLARFQDRSKGYEKWYKNLTELASRYHTLVLSYMHDADDRLRNSAAKLLETSQEFLRK
jgi:hypothetical protein